MFSANITRRVFHHLLNDYLSIIPRKLKMSYKPWMRHKEIDLIKTALTSIKPKNCLEWGAGYSTLYFPKYLPKSTNWLAIEHDLGWANKLEKLNRRHWVKIAKVVPNTSDWQGEGTYEEFKDYVEYPSGRSFDLIIIDGRARLHCVTKSIELLSNNGVVLLHDVNREKYRSAENSLPYSEFFQDRRSGYGGIWIGAKRPLQDILDVDFLLRVWDLHNNLSRRFSLSKAT